MKIIITEDQFEKLKEPKVLHIPDISWFGRKNEKENWNTLQIFMNRRGNPPFTIGGDLDLYEANITDLGNLQSVAGDLDLYKSKIEDLGNLKSVGGHLDLRQSKIKDLGNLQSVGGYLDLNKTKIEDLGNLQSIGGDLILQDTPISEKYSEEQIRQMVDVKGLIEL